MDPVSGTGDASPDLPKRGARVVADLVLGKDAAADLRGDARKRLEIAEKTGQGILRVVGVLGTSVGLGPGGVLEQDADPQKLGGIQASADRESFERSVYL